MLRGRYEAWAALADSLIHGLEHRDARPHDTQYSNGIDAAPKRGKKRVRRIHLELSLFRDQVRDLDLKLKRLKLQNASCTGVVKSQNLVENGSSRDQNSIWNGMAERQLKERLRAEQQQQQLKKRQLELANMSVGYSKNVTRASNKWLRG